MTTINYGIVTLANCEPSYRETAFGLMSKFGEELKSDAGALVVRYGYFGTGLDAGALVFTQLYEDLDGFDKAQNVYSDSGFYKSLIESGKVSVIMRNIVRMVPIEFTPGSDNDPKYMVFTKAKIMLEDKNSAMDGVAQIAKVFSDNGAITLRFGQLITGSSVGEYLLAVSYPSMDSIEKTYDELNENLNYKNLVNKVDVNRREIVRLMS